MKQIRKFLDGPYCVVILFALALFLVSKMTPEEPQQKPQLTEKTLSFSHKAQTLHNEVIYGRR